MMNKRKQQGIGLIGLIFLAAVIGFIAVTSMKIVPSFFEYQAVKRAVVRAANGSTPAEVRELFTKQAQIDDINSIGARDIEITKDSAGNVVVSFAYEKKMELAGPVSLVIDYSGSSKSR
ncbi:DUF4845 domain-containing protein [Derxia gummosa]|uniref:DUF4845 domain-containing protein n=1 Tax=Derxia gummosa DSM 723 TaxID=1121388 RepID=A0A8B6X7S7_9BURK|nr:DUF4845 domain-containing protein [Derxia gummosa]